ncbi:hypothetical protein RB213_008760 [Colletotrichum asianum]
MIRCKNASHSMAMNYGDVIICARVVTDVPRGSFLVKISVAVFTLVFCVLFIRFTPVDDVASREPFEGFHTRLSPRLTKQVGLLGVALKVVLNNQLLGSGARHLVQRSCVLDWETTVWIGLYGKYIVAQMR